MMKELNLLNLGELSRFFIFIQQRKLGHRIKFLFILNNRLRTANNLIWLVLFLIMSYCATVIYWTSVENSRQKLAVVSDPNRSLVSAHIIFPCVGFFLHGETICSNSCSVCLVYMAQLKLNIRLATKKLMFVEIA